MARGVIQASACRMLILLREQLGVYRRSLTREAVCRFVFAHDSISDHGSLTVIASGKPFSRWFRQSQLHRVPPRPLYLVGN